MFKWLGRAGNAGSVAILRLFARFRRTPRITIDERRVKHIFRRADGHLPDDTPENRGLLLSVANNPRNRLGEDRFGVVWAEQTMPDGSQVWVQIRTGQIINGGLNPKRRNFDLASGLSAGPKGAGVE